MQRYYRKFTVFSGILPAESAGRPAHGNKKADAQNGRPQGRAHQFSM